MMKEDSNHKHASIKFRYEKLNDKLHTQTVDKSYQAINEVVEVGVEYNGKCQIVINGLQELIEKVLNSDQGPKYSQIRDFSYIGRS